MKIIQVYQKLLKNYGLQGWWPLNNKYCPDNHKLELSKGEIFEISIGAILTQNTSWNNANTALNNLREKKLLTPKNILNADNELLTNCVKPAGYYNQKIKYLKNFTKFFQKLKRAPGRMELLKIKGIGKETADSILLYAYKQPNFIVDAYTKRFFTRLGIIKGKNNYEEIKKLVEEKLPRKYELFQEFHALIVEHAKKHYSRKPYGLTDSLFNPDFQ